MTMMETLILFICFFSIPSLPAFLLDDKTPSPNSALTDKHYIVVIDSLHEEKMARQRLEVAVTQLHRQLIEKTENLTNLPATCTCKLEVESKIEMQKVKNETENLLQNITRQNEELQNMYFELRHNHSQLKGDNEQLQKELNIVKNDSAQIRKKMTDLQQLKGIDELQTIKTLQMDTETLKSQVHMLSLTQTARGQDFLALYNNSIASKLDFDKDIGKLSLNVNDTMRQIVQTFRSESPEVNNSTSLNPYSCELPFNPIERDRITHALPVYGYLKEKNTNIESETSSTIIATCSSIAENNTHNLKLGALDQKIREQKTYLEEKILNTSSTLRQDFSQQVAITSCAVASNVNTYDILKFAKIKFSKGNVDVNRFKTTGTFRCEVPGLYIIALTIMTNNGEGLVYIRRNGSKLVGVYISAIQHGDYHTGSGFVSTSLTTGDEVTLIVERHLHIYGNFEESCVTIAKID